ncbi:MAG: Gfo/Idh/MocA family oxidoreductase [Verrucomicrobiota bacterium]|jgi:predicted dehydrogenase
MNKLRFGILGAADIARKNWKSILNSGNATVTAVASRDLARSRRFIKELQAEAPFKTTPVALGSYEELLASPNVDAVYIPLPTGRRKEWVLRAAAAGKHIVCEKPCALNAADLREMLSACRKKRVQFMDGVMFAHNPRLNRICEVLDDGRSVGRIKRIMSNFSFHLGEDRFPTNVRTDSRLEPAGCLGDIGWYCIRFALYALHGRLPREVTGRILSQRGGDRSPSPVPTDFSAELIFDDDTSAGFYCSFIAEYQHWVHVSGTKGWLRIDDFVHPVNDLETTFEVNRQTIRVKAGGGKRVRAETVAQPTNMIRNFANQVFSGKLNDEWPEIALQTQQVMDACLESARKNSAVELLNR